jgi:hypothetical protein
METGSPPYRESLCGNGYCSFACPLSHTARQPATKNLEKIRYFSCLHACQTIVPYGTVDAFLANEHTLGTVNVRTYV